MTNENGNLKSDEIYAMEYVQGLKIFYQHLFLYVFIALFFTGGIYLTHQFIPVYIQFVMVGWAFGLLFHGLNAFEVISFFGPKWERKQVEKKLGRKL